MSRESRIEMHCEDMSVMKLMLAHDANGCGSRVGRAQCNSALSAVIRLSQPEQS